MRKPLQSLLVILLVEGALGFVFQTQCSSPGTALLATGKKRKRRRKKPVDIPTETEAEEVSFKFDREEAISLGITNQEEVEETFMTSGVVPEKEKVLALPDIKDTLGRKKKKEREVEEEEEEVEDRIDRRDLAKFKKLLEVDPNADTEFSNFKEEEYGVVSILLGENAKSFIGIPLGPLQIGHFFGSLAIFLMAFVSYPGFPLTNLPSPLRGAFQGGLGTVYAVNFVLAVLSTFQAGERGQPKLLWAMKTFTIGGLAYDQLTQIPTTAQIEERKARKGKRKWKKK